MFVLIFLVSICSSGQFSPTNRQIISKRTSITPVQRNLDFIYSRDVHNDFDKFIGTWSYFDNQNIFTLKIEKVEDVYLNEPNDTVNFLWSDMLYGYFKLESSQQVIVDYINNRVFPLEYFPYNMESICFIGLQFDNIWIKWSDPSHHLFNVDANIKYFRDLATNEEFLEFEITRSNGTSELSYPTLMQLKKQ